MKKFVVNPLFDVDARFVVEDNAEIGDKVYLFTNSVFWAKLYCLWLNLAY